MKNQAKQIKRPAFMRAGAYRRSFTLAIIILLLSLPLSSATHAAAGDLDPSFGNGGKVTTNFSRFDLCNDIALQADGKILAAGASISFDLDPDFLLVRYNTDGSVDTTFGSGGKVATDFPGQSFIQEIAIQPDGKIVAAGFSLVAQGFNDFVLARYNTDGSLDLSFGAGGKVTTDFSGGPDSIQAVALQADGKIVAAGDSRSPAGPLGASTRDFAVARYNTNGSLDMTFGDGGKVTTDILGDGDNIFSVLIEPDGKIVAAGVNFLRFAGGDIAVVRYNTDGSLDTTFGMGGKVTTDFFGFTDQAFGIARLSDGKLVLAGRASSAPFLTSSDFALVRYNTNGSLDTTFGTGGKVTTDFFGQFDLSSSLAIQPDNKIVIGGQANINDQNSEFALARYNSDGSLDATFGSGGKITTDFTGSSDGAFSIALQPDGRILAGGLTINTATGQDIALARYIGVSFDICLQDDRIGSSLQIDSASGDYIFNNCDTGSTLSGRGTLTVQGCVITLMHRTADRNLLARINTCQHQGNAVVSTFMPGLIGFSGINDSNTADNTCACR